MLDFQSIENDVNGNVFRRVRTSASAHGARTRDRIAHKMTFIGVDGEGQKMLDGDHRYVLLSVGDKSLAALYSWEGELPDDANVSFVEREYLTYREIFPFLWREFQASPDACFVGFYLGYDFVHWVRDLPEDRARLLLSAEGRAKRRRTDGTHNPPFPVYVDGWEIDFLGFKRFRIQPHEHRARQNTPEICWCGKEADFAWPDRPRGKWMYICDSGPYWQTSFLNAIDPKNWPDPVVSDSEYATILEGKSERGAAKLGPDMVRYNLLENEVLSRITALVNKGLVESHVRLRKEDYYGPGQAAQAWLTYIQAPTHKEIAESVPSFALEAARKSYYGGWFEVFMHGPVPGITYEYDINSAYPAVIANLPCLLHGEWTEGAGTPPNTNPTIRFVEAQVSGRDGSKVGSMLYRRESGHISRPIRASGWYVWSELVAAQKAKLITKVKIHKWVDYHGCNCKPPISDIRDLYSQRLEVGKNTPRGKGLKLVYNSVYGKFAQSIGEPKFANSVYASLITAGCRTQILQAIESHPKGIKDLVMVATDGVYFRSPHPSLPMSTAELGKWSVAEKSNLSVFMPGVYWDDKTRKGGAIHSRGIAAGDLKKEIARIDRMWNSGLIPELTVIVKFAMTSAVQAIAWNNWAACGQVFENKTRVLNATPELKRNPDLRRVDDVLVSMPYNGNLIFPSWEYDGTFGEKINLRKLDPENWGEYVMPDGTAIEVLQHAFQELRDSNSDFEDIQENI